jgi:hypothetical protein
MTAAHGLTTTGVTIFMVGNVGQGARSRLSSLHSGWLRAEEFA